MKVVRQIVTQMEAAGAQAAAISLHKKMLDDGYDSEVYFLYKKTNAYSSYKNVYCLLDERPKSIKQIIFILSHLVRILRENRNGNFIFHTTYANIIGSFLAKLCGVKNVYIVHHSLKEASSRIKITVDWFLGTFGFYYKVICVSNTVKKRYLRYNNWYLSKIVVIHNGIEDKDISNTGKYDWICESKFLNLVTAGRLHSQKNHSIIFDAIVKNPKLRLIIAGHGELEESYKKFIMDNSISDRIILLGEVPPGEVLEFLSKGDIFIFPSAKEAFGFSLIEAMSIGLPVVASDIESMHEVGGGKIVTLPINDNGKSWSIFFAQENIEKLNLRDMSEQSLSVSNNFTFSEMYSKYISLLNLK